MNCRLRVLVFRVVLFLGYPEACTSGEFVGLKVGS